MTPTPTPEDKTMPIPGVDCACSAASPIVMCPMHEAAPQLLEAFKERVINYHKATCNTHDIEKCPNQYCLDGIALISTATGQGKE